LFNWSWGRNATSIHTHLQLATICEYTNKNLENGFIWHSKSLDDAPFIFVKKKLWFFTNVSQLSWSESTHHYESILFALDLKVIGPIKSCQGVYQNWSMWIIQLGVHSKRRWMENDVQNTIWWFWICCDAIWPYQHTCYLSTSNERFFCEYLNNFMVCYINDILIFSKNMEDYKHHVHLVLEKL
jgi:hypothetical protein